MHPRDSHPLRTNPRGTMVAKSETGFRALNKTAHSEYCCRVCGLEYPVPIWGEDGQYPMLEECACCSVLIGYEDIDKGACIAYRNDWLRHRSSRWHRQGERPQSWSLKDQLRSIPEDYQ